MSFRGAIVSVGGASEPIIVTLNEAKPQCVLFVVSTESKRELDSKILPALHSMPQYSLLETAAIADLADCYAKVREGIPKWLKERELAASEVYIDITGGTKPMSAGLAMAAAEQFSHFTYVSGTDRSKEGLGVVVTGTEKIVPTVNPWDKLAIRERERATWLFRNGYAGQAAELLQQAAQKCGPELRQELGTFAEMALCFSEIDRFRFRGVWQQFGRQKAKLELIFCGRGQFSVFQKLSASAEHWQKLEVESQKNGTEVDATLRELMANAKRRAAQKRYDDAIARLYRAAELFVQGKLYETFQARLGKVRRDQIPSVCQSEWVAEFGNKGEYELGVRDVFRALRFSAHPEYREIAEQYRCISNHLQKRNNSILAHGLSPCSEEAFSSFWEALLEVVQVRADEIPYWPDIEF
jgi:CRISPR-associated protein (TIGR02710 family)